MEERPYLLTIAGFDPSAGAGILADIKTFEINKVYGQAVATSLTFQNESSFEGLDWVSETAILRQIDVLASINKFQWIKIGLIQDLDVLDNIVDHLKTLNPECQIIWDPILKASAGFTFHQEIDREKLKHIASSLTLITPNMVEIQMLFPEMAVHDATAELAKYCHVLLKGGHSEDNADDILCMTDGKVHKFKGTRLPFDKHGTGCVFSAAILTNLAKGYELPEACREAKDYVTDFIGSHQSLLGYHYV
jgi:hydroxymethylpyrimidine/phosphomethylpyrimidine kinase